MGMALRVAMILHPGAIKLRLEVAGAIVTEYGSALNHPRPYGVFVAAQLTEALEFDLRSKKRSGRPAILT